MINAVLGGAVACSAMYYAWKYQPKEVRKINAVFKNIRYQANGLFPRRIQTRRSGKYTEYIYEVPPGLVDDPKLFEILPKTLRKPVSVRFKGVLILRVYNEGMPSRISFDWEKANDWRISLGVALDGSLRHDFDLIPHMIVAGATRQGKTALLKLIISQIIRNHPDDAELYLIDLKGGLEFGRFRNLPQVKSVASSANSAESTLTDVLERLRNDMSYFAQKGYNDVKTTNIRRRTFVITDEAAELADAKQCLDYLSEICRLGGALGYRNIFATQYPTADTLPRQVKQNSDARISFRLPTAVASRVALDEGGAELLDRPGRAIYKTVDKTEFQAYYSGDDEISTRLNLREANRNAEKAPQKDRAAGEDIIDISGFDLRD